MSKVIRTSGNIELTPAISVIIDNELQVNGNISGNIIAGNVIVSEIISGHGAPFVVNSTDMVPNLYVSRAAFADVANTVTSVTQLSYANAAAEVTLNSTTGVVYSLGLVPSTIGNNAVYFDPQLTYNSSTETINASRITISGVEVTTVTSNISSTGDVVLSGQLGNIIATLSPAAGNVGNFGSSNAIPVITVNAKGLVTNVSLANISSFITTVGTSGIGQINTGNSLIFTTSTNMTVNAVNNILQINTPQNISTVSNVQFSSLRVNNGITANVVTANANITVGNVLSAQTIISSNAQPILFGPTISSGSQLSGAGLVVGANAAIMTYNSANLTWVSNIPFSAAAVYDNGNRVFSSAQNFSTGSNQDVTILGTYNTLTANLAIVNGNVGTFGSSSNIPIITVNAKGLVTQVSTTPLTGLSFLNEVPTGNVNGNNTIFTVSVNPRLLFLFVNGSFQSPATPDYTISGTTITFTVAPPISAKLYAQGII